MSEPDCGYQIGAYKSVSCSADKKSRGIDYELVNLKKLIEELRNVTGELLDKVQPVSIGNIEPRVENSNPCETVERSYVGAEIKSCADSVSMAVRAMREIIARVDM